MRRAGPRPALGEQSIFVEIYFPKKVDCQGRVYQALKDGLKEAHVKKYLVDNLEHLLTGELSQHLHLLDPERYGVEALPLDLRSRATQRINDYKSRFFGWSMYEVDGVFLGGSRRTVEERVQVIRLIFKFTSSLSKKQKYAHRIPLRALVHWVASRYAELAQQKLWEEKERFFNNYGPSFSGEQQAVLKEVFEGVVKEVAKWIYDCGLFVFGFLTRELGQATLSPGAQIQDEIWIATDFDLNVSILRPLLNSANKTTPSGTAKSPSVKTQTPAR